MNTNALAERVAILLATKCPRVYRDKPIDNPTFPFIVFSFRTVVSNPPSVDYNLFIDIFDNAGKSAREIENIADSIEMLNNHIIFDDILNANFMFESRQFVANSDLISAQAISIDFRIRTYQ